MKKPVSFAVVGYGLIGKRHATIINNHEQAVLSAIIETETEKRNIAAEDFDVPVFQNIGELKKSNSDIEVINICTPNYLHAPIAIEALDHGYHVIIEKPMALKKRECEEVISKSREASKNVFIVTQNRYNPPAKWLKEVFENGILGKTYMVQINCYWNRDERYYKKNDWRGGLEKDGGTLFTQFSHFIDIMHWVFGDIENIQARFANFNHRHNTQFEDSGIVNFDFVNGGIGCINFSTSCRNKNMESSITVISENGSVKIGGQYMNEVEYCEIDKYEMPVLEETSPPNDYGPYKGSAANHHFLIQDVIDVINSGSFNDSNAREGLKVVDIIERIYKPRDLKKLFA